MEAVAERVDLTGQVLKPLDEGMVEALVPELEAAEIESVAIGYMHAYANPDHETPHPRSLGGPAAGYVVQHFLRSLP